MLREMSELIHGLFSYRVDKLRVLIGQVRVKESCINSVSSSIEWLTSLLGTKVCNLVVRRSHKLPMVESLISRYFHGIDPWFKTGGLQYWWRMIKIGKWSDRSYKSTPEVVLRGMFIKKLSIRVAEFSVIQVGAWISGINELDCINSRKFLEESSSRLWLKSPAIVKSISCCLVKWVKIDWKWSINEAEFIWGGL